MSNEEKAADMYHVVSSVNYATDYMNQLTASPTIKSFFKNPSQLGYNVEMRGANPSVIEVDEMSESLDMVVYVLVEADGQFILFTADKLAEHLSRRERLGGIAIQEWFYDGTNDDFDKTS